MKTREYIMLGVIAVLSILLARKDVKIVEITLPVRTNTKVITTPAPINEGKKDGVITHFETVKVKNPLNDTLVRRYLEQKDSLASLNFFINATRQRDYVELLKDSLQTITVETRVNGFMREQVITYKTNEQKIRIPTKNRKRLYVGGVFQMPTILGRSPTFGGRAVIVSEKTLYSLQYDLQGTAQIGIGLRIF